MLREITAVVAPSTPATSRTRELFAASHLHCQHGGPVVTGEECLACERIVSVCPSRGHRTVKVRCLWTEGDRVDQVMALADHAPRVSLHATLHSAAVAARTEQVHDLLVFDDREVVGMVCRCTLEEGEPDAKVAEVMIPHVWTIPETASLGQAASAMESLEVGVLAVASGDVLRGVLTAQDLGLELPVHVG